MLNRMHATLVALLTAIAVAAMTPGAQAAATDAGADYPHKPVRIVVPSPPGGTIDPITRILAEALAKSLGQSFIIDNRPGANFNVGMALVAKADADGYTLVMASSGALATNIHLYKELPFHPVKDFTPVALYGDVPNILVVNPSLPVKTLREFTDYAKANPDRINFGSSGNGSSMHLAGELYKTMTKTQMTHVPYKGADLGTQDLISGRIQAMFQLMTGISQQVKADRVRAIAVLAPKRSSTLPNVPTTAEAGIPGLESSAWFGLMAPKGTPKAVVAKLNKEVNELLATPAFRKRITDIGVEPMGGTPEDFVRYLHKEISKWGDVVRVSGAKID
jgi:tripartite-type tricarboxylate transporter receptor subunit TctC